MTFVARVTQGAFRNALAAVGIAVSVAAMSVTANLIGSLYLEATSGLRRMGSNLMFVVPKDLAQFGRSGRPLNMGDLEALRRLDRVFDSAYAVLTVRGAVQACGRTRVVQIIGTVPSAYEMEQWQMASGRFVTSRDVDARAAVAVLGSQLHEDLGCVQMGGYLNVSNAPYRVIGSVAPQGQRFGINRDDVVLIPTSIFEARYGGRSHGMAIALQRRLEVSSDAALAQIRRVLRRTHRITSNTDDFDVQTQVQMLETIAGISNATTLIVLLLMGVSLLVAAIGVLNSILVSVAARTGEIGMRRAVGARKVDVMRHFLGEAGLVTLGGVVGGGLCAVVATVILTRVSGLPLWFNVPALTLAGVTAIVLGFLAGAVPARVAANLDPIEAMRHE